MDLERRSRYATIIDVAEWIRANSDREDDIHFIKSGVNFESVNENYQVVLANERVRKSEAAEREAQEIEEALKQGETDYNG